MSPQVFLFSSKLQMAGGDGTVAEKDKNAKFVRKGFRDEQVKLFALCEIFNDFEA